jgi:hypothetical protein
LLEISIENWIMVHFNIVWNNKDFKDIIHEFLVAMEASKWCCKEQKWAYSERHTITTTMMIDLFLDLGNSIMKSIEISFHKYSGICKHCISIRFIIIYLSCYWKISPSSMKVWMSFFMPSQKMKIWSIDILYENLNDLLLEMHQV